MRVLRLCMVTVILLGGIFVGSGWALCSGTGDDTDQVQAAIHTRTPLPAGSCLVTRGVSVGSGEALVGQGPGTTYILPTVAGLTVVTLTAATARVENVQIGTPTWPYVGMIGLSAYSPTPIDRVYARNVMVTGFYSIAFSCQNVVSSRMDFVQIWNFQPNTMAAAWLACSDWTMTQVEAHEQAASDTGGAAIWLWDGSSAIRFFGGNVSTKTGSLGQYVIGSGGQFYGTTFYQEP